MCGLFCLLFLAGQSWTYQAGCMHHLISYSHLFTSLLVSFLVQMQGFHITVVMPVFTIPVSFSDLISNVSIIFGRGSRWIRSFLVMIDQTASWLSKQIILSSSHHGWLNSGWIFGGSIGQLGIIMLAVTFQDTLESSGSVSVEGRCTFSLTGLWYWYKVTTMEELLLRRRKQKGDQDSDWFISSS